MQQQIAGWLVPPLAAAALAGIYGVVRMWSQINRQADEQARFQRDIGEINRRLGEHDGHLQKQDVTLGRIEEGVEWIKRTLASAFDGGRERGGQRADGRQQDGGRSS